MSQTPAHNLTQPSVAYREGFVEHFKASMIGGTRRSSASFINLLPGLLQAHLSRIHGGLFDPTLPLEFRPTLFDL